VRPMFDAEVQWFAEHNAVTSLFGAGGGGAAAAAMQPPDGAAARRIAVHAAPQLAAAQYMASPPESAERASAACVLSVSTRVGETGDGRQSVAELTLPRGPDAPPGADARQPLAHAVQSVTRLLAPGSEALLFLKGAGELTALQDLAERCSNVLPVSCLFCQGLVILAQGKEEGAPAADMMDLGGDVDAAMDDVADRSQSSRAFTSFVSAARIARRTLGRLVDLGEAEREDVLCAIAVAQLTDTDGAGEGSAAEPSGEEDDAMEGIAAAANGAAAGDSPLSQHLDFWLLERALRLLEGSGSSKAAAAIALEALAAAPDAKKYEMMRAAAFRRFLDASDLECALQTILKSPFQGAGARAGDAVSEESACALRDCVGLLVNAALDAGRFTWLLKGDLPAPIKELAALALERRARSSEMFVREHLLQELRGADPGGEPGARQRVSSPYEFLYVWQLAREDVVGAAVCAVEWFERVASEGLTETRLFASSSRASLTHSPLALMLTWARIKSRAIAAACAAVRTLPPDRQYVARSRHSILAGYTPTNAAEGVVDLEWLARRHLLARAQMICLTKRLSVGGRAAAHPRAGKMPSTEYVISQADVLLGDQERGVSFAVSSLLVAPVSTEALFLALDLALAWRSDDCGDRLVAGVVSVAGVLSCSTPPGGGQAAGDDGYALSFADMNKLLDRVSASMKAGGRCTSRNWYLAAAEGALEASAGTAGIPRWLSDAAAFGPGVGAEARTFAAGKLGGDASGVVRLWLRYGRLAEAAQLLITGLRESIEVLRGRGGPAAQVDVPYSAIDATLELLSSAIQAGDGGPVERKYYEELRSLASTLADFTTT
jgi:hypothetical protein